MAIAYNNNYDGTTPFSDTCTQFALSVGTEQTYTIPGTDTNAYVAYFGYNSTSNIYVRLNGTAASPAPGASSSTPNQALRPLKRFVKGGDILHFITPDATAQCSVELMSLRS